MRHSVAATSCSTSYPGLYRILGFQHCSKGKMLEAAGLRIASNLYAYACSL